LGAAQLGAWFERGYAEGLNDGHPASANRAAEVLAEPDRAALVARF
jgi:hypothetical protein